MQTQETLEAPLRKLIKRLSEMSIQNRGNPYRAFEWPDSLPDGLWMSPELLTVHGTVTGTLSDPGRGSGQQAATVDCAGTQCGAFGTLPCQFTVRFAIHKR